MKIDILNKLSKKELLSIIIQKDEKIAFLSALNARLEFFIKQLQRAQFGKRSEKLDPDQLSFAFEEVEQSQAAADAGAEQVEACKTDNKPAKPRHYNRGSLPSHLPREIITIEPEEKTCSCCGGALHVMGEDVSELLDIIPAQFKVKEIHRPKYGCRGCEGGVVQAPAPERPIDGGMATTALLAHILIAKYLDGLPLYRQSIIYQRQGINLDRSTLTRWVGRSCWWLKPLYDRLQKEIWTSEKLFADDTTLPVLDPGRGRTKTGRLWAYARDDRPWQGKSKPAVVYIYSEDRKHERPLDHLKDFKGILQVDAYGAYDTLLAARPKDIQISHCWAHWRRKFFELYKAQQSPIAEEAVRRIAEMYKIEEKIRGMKPKMRKEVRQAEISPITDSLKTWLNEKLAQISGKAPLAIAIRYGISRWTSFTAFLEDGRIDMDSNIVERTIRPVAITRKAALFAGSDGGGENWAIVGSLIQSAKLNDVEPFAYLCDVLERLVDGHSINRLDELLPWNYVLTKKLQKVDP